MEQKAPCHEQTMLAAAFDILQQSGFKESLSREYNPWLFLIYCDNLFPIHSY